MVIGAFVFSLEAFNGFRKPCITRTGSFAPSATTTEANRAKLCKNKDLKIFSDISVLVFSKRNKGGDDSNFAFGKQVNAALRSFKRIAGVGIGFGAWNYFVN